MKNGIKLKANKRVSVAMSMALDAIGRGIDKQIARVVKSGGTEEQEVTLRQYLAMAEAVERRVQS